MTIQTMPIDETVDQYFAAWNAEATDRPEIVTAVFADDAYYCDGAVEAAGHEAIIAMMNAIMTQFGEARFQRSSPVDAHHRQARFSWEMVSPDGATIVDGIDAVLFNEEGLITTALGFFGVAIPTGEEPAFPHKLFWNREYDVSSDRLFELVTDLEVSAEVSPNLARIDVLSGEGVGMVRQCTSPEGDSWTETYTEWVPGERFTSVVDVSTYPPSLQALIRSLQMTVVVVPVAEERSRVEIELDTELTEAGVGMIVDGGAGDALFEPILDGWGERLQ